MGTLVKLDIIKKAEYLRPRIEQIRHILKAGIQLEIGLWFGDQLDNLGFLYILYIYICEVFKQSLV